MTAPVSLVVPKLDIAPLRRFVTGFSAILDSGAGQPAILEHGGNLLARLVSQDDWLSDEFAQPHP